MHASCAYALAAGFWILASDHLLALMIDDPGTLTLAQTIKGFAFILITSLSLHALIRHIGAATHAEAALRQDQARLLVMLENMPVMVLALDEDSRLALWNREAERITGYTAAEAIGDPGILERLLPDPDYRRATAETFRRSNLWCRDWERRITCKDGEVRTIAISCIARDFAIADYPGGWGIGVDVTERLAHERELAEARDALEDARDTAEHARAEAETARISAEAANRAKSDFLALMSHELRTPLTAVIGFADVMRGEYFGPLGSPRYHEYCQDIEVSGRHLLGLIDGILELARTESGRYTLAEREIDLPELAAGAVQLLGDRPARKGVSLTLRMERPPRVRGDERALKQVLVNLLGNAVKYTPPGGAVELSIERDRDDGVSLVVADTGIGIPAGELATVLEPFSQASNCGTAGVQGSGLGLSIVRTLVDLHGGDLSVESDLDIGTRVTVRLPAERVLPSP
ncbi:hypothetical protein N825_15910 [Skermanella stibiiresistens SB22]|uniref:histidine kinase n=1 Tax=Skermanella stibiiresistens SB22 TaxID=1385369 RepID=W9GZ51_9PROT|nr:PAS domain-containing sensor histidine kinase [Skermanella stibiiresistens]EWY37886.1 hypothetical protein N825_15910 [Skermanella stibiiresistens SB22]